jgi:hypothetical protein
MSASWKDVLIRYKWMPARVLVRKFGLKKHDVDNFRRRPDVARMLEGWRISRTMAPERLREILKEAWEYYLTVERPLGIDASSSQWIPRLLQLSGIRDDPAGFGFLVDSRYLRAAFGSAYDAFLARGHTTTAYAAFECYPGRNALGLAGVLPFMFYQTHKRVLEHVDTIAMVDHVYIRFHDPATNSPAAVDHLKERLIARYREPGFITGEFLAQFGVPSNFYAELGLRGILASLALKYSADLGRDGKRSRGWSASEFVRKNPGGAFEKCCICGLRPVDLHHLLPRSQYPALAYEQQNVLPLCVQVHQYITRRLWTPAEQQTYVGTYKRWLREKRSDVFDSALAILHDAVYGPGGWLSRGPCTAESRNNPELSAAAGGPNCA